MNLKQLQKKHEDLLVKGRGMYETAEKEKQDFSEAEWTELKQLDTDVAEVLGEIEKAKADTALADRLKATFGAPTPGPSPVGTGEGGKGRTLGEMFTESPQFKNWYKSVAPSGYIPQGARGLISPPVEIKTLPGLFGRKTLVTGEGATSGGAFVETDYTGIYEPIGRYALTVLDLISRRQTTSDLVSFVRQTAQVTQAAAVQEANVTEYAGSTGEISGEKPEGTTTFVEVQLPVETIAVWIPATKRALADVPQLRGILDQELRDDITEELENQLINGTGVAPQLTGVLSTAGILAQAWNTDIVVTARQAITTLMVTGRTIPNGWVLNPNDWETVDLMTDSDGQYFFGGPVRAGTRTLWGIPVAQCVHLAEGEGILANWNKAVLWDREQMTIQVSDSHEDFFIRNLVAILCEMRATFGLISPDSFIVMDLTEGS